MSGRRTALGVALPFLVLALGVTVMVGFIRTRRTAAPKPPARPAALVEVLTLSLVDRAVTVRGQGVVTPARQVVLVPQVAGAVVQVHPALLPGGRVAAGEVLVRVDAREYVLAVRQQEAQVVQAELNLAVERGRTDVARQEWDRLGRPAPPPAGAPDAAVPAAGPSLALREPYLRAAQAAVDGAQAALDRARLNVERATLRAPFDAVVVAEDVEVGQVVGPQTRAAVLVATDAYWVEVSIPASQLAFVAVPGLNADPQDAATAWVARAGAASGADGAARPARVVRALGAVERAGRLARLVLEVPAPLSAAGPAGAGPPPLLLDDFVDVAIDGRPLRGVVEVPRVAVHEGDRVHLMGGDGALVVRDVQVAWRTPDTVLVSAGLDAGDRLVITPVPGAAPGMALRTAAGEASVEAAPRKAQR